MKVDINIQNKSNSNLDGNNNMEQKPKKSDKEYKNFIAQLTLRQNFLKYLKNIQIYIWMENYIITTFTMILIK